MTREELEHAIRAACDVAEDGAVYVFGSQAILAQWPQAPSALRQSMEVDVAPVNRPRQADVIDGALGELSQFHSTHGFYVHGLNIDATTLRARVATLAVSPTERERIDSWVAATAADLGL